MFLVFLMVCCNRSSLKPARPMCDGRPFASPLFRRLAGRGSFFRGFRFRWAVQFVFSLVHCLTLRDAAPCSRKDSLYECSRPCDTLSCLFVIALWLRQSQSILIWPVASIAGSDPSSPSSSPEDPNDEHLEGTLLAPPHSRWRPDALQPPQIQRITLDRNTLVHVPDDGLRYVTWNTRGLIGSVTSSQMSRGRTHDYFSQLIENNNIICLQEVHGKDEFLQAFQVLAPLFRLWYIYTRQRKCRRLDHMHS